MNVWIVCHQKYQRDHGYTWVPLLRVRPKLSRIEAMAALTTYRKSLKEKSRDSDYQVTEFKPLEPAKKPKKSTKRKAVKP